MEPFIKKIFYTRRMYYLEGMNKRQENRNWHWVFWAIYFFVNHFIFSPEILRPFDLFIQVIFVLHNAGTAYTILDWWLPKYQKTKGYIWLFLVIAGTLIFFTILLALSLVATFRMASIPDPMFHDFNMRLVYPTFWSNLGGLTALAIPYFLKQRLEMERRNQQLEKEKLEAELKFLKSQLHPHFLFNALNNIYFLIKKDPDMAAEALAGFSNLLRFQLYDAKNTYVPLDKEITYLKQFAEIAQLRKGNDFEVHWQLPEKVDDMQIPPLLLMPLLENAFKHSGSKEGQIEVQLLLNEEELQFSVSNTKEKENTKMLNGFEVGGIGLTNIQKRLSLLYPDKHQLAIHDEAENFEVDLTLELSDLPATK